MVLIQTLQNLIVVMFLLRFNGQDEARIRLGVWSRGRFQRSLRLASLFYLTLSLGVVGEVRGEFQLTISLDVDNDGQVLAATDGRLISRYLFEFESNVITDEPLEVVNQVDADSILSRLANLKPYLDIDGDGRIAPLSDGALIVGHLEGNNSSALVEAVTTALSTRNSLPEIDSYLRTLEKGIIPSQSLYQVPAPDLTVLSYGSPTLYLLESFGFSSSGRRMLVRATYLDDGDSTPKFRYGMFVFDLETRRYEYALNVASLGSGLAREIDIKDARIVEAEGKTLVFALARFKANGEEQLVVVEDGSTISLSLITDIAGFDAAVAVEAFLVGQSGRFVAIQTTSAQLALDAEPDTNDLSDIYLLDREKKDITRVSYLSGAEVYEPTYLADIFEGEDKIEIAFVSAATFVDASKIDRNSSINTNSEFQKSDVIKYLASVTDSGVSQTAIFSVVGVDSDGFAVGQADSQDTVKVTQSGIFFSSVAETLVSDDDNEQKDGFVVESNLTRRLLADQLGEFSAGHSLMDASDGGNFYVLLSNDEKVTSNGFQQAIYVDRANASWRIVSANPNPSDGWVISGRLSPNGGRVAFTAPAPNLAEGELVTRSGDLFVQIYF